MVMDRGTSRPDRLQHCSQTYPKWQASKPATLPSLEQLSWRDRSEGRPNLRRNRSEYLYGPVWEAPSSACPRIVLRGSNSSLSRAEHPTTTSAPSAQQCPE